MKPTSLESPETGSLRTLARQRLRDAAEAGSTTVLSPAALSALMRLAVTPEHAADALVLQQELQLHQIEIEVLADELRTAARRPAADAAPAE